MYLNPELMEFKPDDFVLNLETGEPVHAWLFHAHAPARGIIVFLHGNGENRSSHISSIYWLLHEGFDILAPEYPGYGETDGSPSPKNTVATGHAALRYVKEHYPGLPIVVYGQSLGGAVALRATLDLKNEVPVRLFVADSTFLSYQEAGKKVLAKSFLTWPIQEISYLVLSDEYAPGDKVAELAPVPILVIHDIHDPVVPFSLGQEIYDKAKEPREIWKLETPADDDGPAGRHAHPFYGVAGVPVRARFLKKLNELIPKP